MGDDNKIDPNTNPTEVPPKDAKTELSEEELKRVSGGQKYLEIKLSEVLISSVSPSSSGDK